MGQTDPVGRGLISDVLGEAFDVYRRLWGRSVLVGGLIFAVVSLGDAFTANSRSAWPELVALLLTLVGSVLVQGALVLVVADLHDGREPATISEYYDRTRDKLGTLLGASILYGFGAIVIAPIALWSLAIPLVMIEGLSRREAFRRSSLLTRDRIWRILLLVLISAGIGGLIRLAIAGAFDSVHGFVAVWAVGTIANAIAAPYSAHVLTVLYYRLTAPERPVLPDRPPRDAWQSIWDKEKRS